MESSTYISGPQTFTKNTDDDITFTDKNRYLIGRNGKPLRLYTKDGKPVTDFDGDPLQSITGRVLLVFNKVKSRLEDVSGFPLRDCWGRLPSHPQFDPEEGTNADPSIGPLVQKTGQPRVIFDLFGFPLTDNQGRPLVNSSGKYLLTFDSKGEPVCDLEGRLIIESPTYFNLKNTERFYDNSSGLPLQIFDTFKRPLTSIEGFPLLDIMGESLVITDNQNNPIKTSYGSNIYDCKWRNSSHLNYDPTKKCSHWKQLPPVVDENGNATILFDQTGFPLTNNSGIPLIDSEGSPLFKYDKRKGIISKDEFDVIQLSVSNYNPSFLRSICNDSGKPARFYNFQGKPLTNWLGEPLKHADGCIMLKFGFRGSPKCDFQGLPIYDEFGVPLTECNCTPYEAFELNDDFPRETDALKNGIKLYDGSGMPVTDHRGFHLTKASRKFMIKRNSNNIPVCDSQGGPLFTESGLPLLKSFDEPLLGPKGKVCRLFDHKGHPLTNSKGVPLRLINGEYTIKIDKIGRIIGDWLGGPIYDCNGCPMTFSIKFNPSKSPKKISRTQSKHYSLIKNTKQLFNRSGFPLTDPNGELLANNCGKSLIHVDLETSHITDTSGHAVYERVGCVFKPDKRTFCHKESVLKAESKALSTSVPEEIKNNTKESHTNFNQRQLSSENFILFNGRYKIFDRESFPLLDRYGAVLETSEKELVLKFDKSGQLFSDYRGRDVYDKDGMPLTNVNGYWRDKSGNPLRLFTQCGLPLTDIRGKALYHNKGFCLLGRDEIGRPLIDFNNHLVYDACGIPSNDCKFCPRKQPHSDQLCLLLDLKEKPLRIYNSKGWPLNDENGLPLVSNNGKNLIIFNNLGLESIEDSSGNTVYDDKGIPLGSKQDCSLLTMSGTPFRLFNNTGKPLTDYLGVPLKFASDLCLIVFDMFGRPFQDSEGGALFDSSGNQLGSSKFNPEFNQSKKKRIKQIDDSPVILFDHSGKPLTDRFGNILVNSKGEDIIYIESGIPLCTIDGCSLYDKLGNEFIPTPNTFIQLVGE